MATEKQILANRKNARSSTGPRTTAGKACSSMNARRHGLASLLEGASPETCLDLEALSDRLSRIEIERLRLYQEIERGLEKGDIQQIAQLLRRLAALDRYRQRCSSSLRNK
jgi:RNA polymerase-interacting CarD/CdnL/TRCF family regulator